MPRVVHFDFTAKDPDRAADFYSKVFGWEFHKWEGPMDYWLITTGPDDQQGINGGMSRADDGNRISYTLDVPSVDEYTEKVTANGGTVLMPKSPIPGVGWFALVADTEGNAFGIMQPDESAA